MTATDINQEQAYLYWVGGTYWAFAESEVSMLDEVVSGYELKAAGTFEAMMAAHRLLADR